MLLVKFKHKEKKISNKSENLYIYIRYNFEEYNF